MLGGIMSEKDTTLLKGETFVVDLPYGKSILIAGITPTDAAEVFGEDSRITTCDKNEARSLEYVSEDTHVLLTTSALLPQDASRLRRSAKDLGLQVVGDNWTVDRLRDWKQGAVINTAPAEENSVPRPRVEPDYVPVPQTTRGRYLERLAKQRPDVTNGHRRRPKSTNKGLPRSIVLVGVRRYDLSENRKWILTDERILVKNVQDITTLSTLSVDVRFVVYDPAELGPLKTKVWERILGRHAGVEVYEVEGAIEMFEVTRNLIEFGIHPLPASIIDSMDLEPQLDETEMGDSEDDQGDAREEDGMALTATKNGVVYTETPPMELSIPLGQTIHVIGVNQQAYIGSQGNGERFVWWVPSAATKLASSLPEDGAVFVLLKSVVEPVRSQICTAVTALGKMCIAIPDWGVPQLRDWIESVSIQWDGEVATEPSLDVAEDSTEDHTDDHVESEDVVTDVPPPQTDFEALYNQLELKYQEVIRRNQELEQSNRTLSTKVATLTELLDELEQDNKS